MMALRLRKTSFTSGLRDQIEVTLAVADLGVFQPVPFRRRRTQRLGEMVKLIRA